MQPTTEVARQLARISALSQAIQTLAPLVNEESLEAPIAELVDAANSALDSLLDRGNVRASTSRAIVEDHEDAAARRIATVLCK